MQTYNYLDLKKYNSYRLDSIARNAFFPETIEDVATLFFDSTYDNAHVIGGGYNIILSKADYTNDTFIFFRENFSSCHREGNYIIAQSGASLKQLSQFALDNSLAGLEVFYDIPGTLGGAIFMNAGAYGEDIFGVLDEVTVVNKAERAFQVINTKEIRSGYRFSHFQNSKDIIFSSKIDLQPADPLAIRAKMDEILVKRSRFPKWTESPNAGSVFLRPSGPLSVGEMVEKIGLKGTQMGGAQISEKHGGFIINTANAKVEDILALINFIKEKVKASFDIDLELEQRLI